MATWSTLKPRQRRYRDPGFPIAAVARDAGPGCRLREWRVPARAGRRTSAVGGCDLSMGMLRAAGHPAMVEADVAALPFRDGHSMPCSRDVQAVIGHRGAFLTCGDLAAFVCRQGFRRSGFDLEFPPEPGTDPDPAHLLAQHSALED